MLNSFLQFWQNFGLNNRLVTKYMNRDMKKHSLTKRTRWEAESGQTMAVRPHRKSILTQPLLTESFTNLLLILNIAMTDVLCIHILGNGWAKFSCRLGQQWLSSGCEDSSRESSLIQAANDKRETAYSLCEPKKTNKKPFVDSNANKILIHNKKFNFVWINIEWFVWPEKSISINIHSSYFVPLFVLHRLWLDLMCNAIDSKVNQFLMSALISDARHEVTSLMAAEANQTLTPRGRSSHKLPLNRAQVPITDRTSLIYIDNILRQSHEFLKKFNSWRNRCL